MFPFNPIVTIYNYSSLQWNVLPEITTSKINENIQRFVFQSFHHFLQADATPFPARGAALPGEEALQKAPGAARRRRLRGVHGRDRAASGDGVQLVENDDRNDDVHTHLGFSCNFSVVQVTTSYTVNNVNSIYVYRIM